MQAIDFIGKSLFSFAASHLKWPEILDHSAMAEKYLDSDLEIVLAKQRNKLALMIRWFYVCYDNRNQSEFGTFQLSSEARLDASEDHSNTAEVFQKDVLFD